MLMANNSAVQTPPPSAVILYTGVAEATGKWLAVQSTDSGFNQIINENVPYFGHLFFIDQQNNGMNVSLARLVCRVHWEFKEPLVEITTPSASAIIVQSKSITV